MCKLFAFGRDSEKYPIGNGQWPNRLAGKGMTETPHVSYEDEDEGEKSETPYVASCEDEDEEKSETPHGGVF